MIKYVCDRCGKEISERIEFSCFFLYSKRCNYDIDNMELCNLCADKIYKKIKETLKKELK